MGCLKNNNINYNESSLYDRIKKLLVSFEWSDCSFSVDDKIFKAHKLILGISSPVFEAMFYGPLSNNNDITITDIQPDIFQLLLNYIYTDKVEISGIEQAFELLYAAKKYLLENLNDMCITYIHNNISIDNAIDILNYPQYLQDEKPVKLALKLLCKHASYLLEEKKCSISTASMKAILECDQMNIDEKHLIKHVFEWSTHYCDQNNIPATLENRRSILENEGLFGLLRFTSLNLKDLEEVIADSNSLLWPHESKELLQTIGKSNNVCKEKVGINSSPRNPLKHQWCMCYRSPLRPVAPLVIDSNNYVIISRVRANKSVFINSLSVPTRMAPAVYFRNNSSNAYSEQLSVSIACESDNNIIKCTNFMNTVEYNSMVDIELTEPCFIKKDQWYKICFAWPENRFPTYSYIVEYRDKKCMYGNLVTFEFDDMVINSRYSGTFLEGLKFCL